MKLSLILALLIFTINCRAASSENESFNDKSKIEPPKKLDIFEPNIISNFDFWNFTPSFSKNMQTLVFVRWQNPDLSVNQTTIQKLFISRKTNGKWGEPVEIAETSEHRVDWCHFSPDGKYFLVSYAKPHSKQYNFPAEKDFNDFDIWIAPTNENGDIDWHNFKPITSGNINRVKTPENKLIGYVHNETAPRMDLQGNLYFWTERLDDGGGERDIYFAAVKSLEKLEWNQAKILPSPINSPFRESGVVVSKDGSWIIFTSAKPGGFGGEDLYLSKKLNEEKWSEPVNLGKEINSEKDEIVPELSPDNKALFFSSNRLVKYQKQLNDRDGGKNTWSIYWISLEALDKLIR